MAATVKPKPVTVKVKRTRKSGPDNTVYVIPDGEFTQAGFATANSMPVRGKVYAVIQTQLKRGLIKSVGMKQIGRGRPSVFFTKADTNTPAA